MCGRAAADEVSPPEAATPHAAHESLPSNGASEPRWLTYAAFRNDVFTELDPPIDDVGFTHDNVLVLRRRAGSDTFGGSFVHRFLTSRQDRRRWDLVELFATAERAWQRDDAAQYADPAQDADPAPARLRATTALRAGPTFGGNFGGRYIQNAFHAITKLGPTLDEGLANDYPGGREVGFVLGGRARASIGDERWQGYSFVDGQLALGGTGATSFEATLGGSAASAHLGAHVEVALTRYHVGDPYLALPGAYRPGLQFEWRAGIDVHWSRFRIGYEYRANESGSGEPMGVVEFSSAR